MQLIKNMDLQLKPVLEKYSKYTIEKQPSPTYVEIYTKSENDIVLAYSKVKQSTGLSSEYTPKNNECEKDELDLTGSPLKLDLSLHTILDETMIPDEPQLWKKEELLHGPIDVNIARSISTLPKDDVVPMWVLCNPASEEPGKPILLTIQSNNEEFNRGIVTYEGALTLDEIDVEELIKEFAKQEQIDEDLISILVDSKYTIAGMTYGQLSVVEQLNTPHGGFTELHCEWTTKTVHTPYISCKVRFEQEVTIGHMASPCNAVWKSVCALHNINQLLVDMMAAGTTCINLETAVITPVIPGMKRYNNAKRLKELLNETEMYTYTADCPAGGCLCVTEDTTSLRQCMADMKRGSSNDFTYKLWDVLRECETAEELMTLLLQALTFISSGKIRPFIDVSNKSLLSKLVLKLSRGHSQTSKVLKNLRSSPPQALSLVAQVGVDKTMWEYTRIMSLLEHSFFLARVWRADARSGESIEQINQTIQDMTMGGEFNLNPFESISTTEHSIRMDSESFCFEEESNDLTVDDFVSLKKHGLVSDKKDANEVPLIPDEIDISSWKNILMRFAQIHACLEHLYRAETCLRIDFSQMKSIASRLVELYVTEKSPIKTVGQLMSDPVVKINIPITNNTVQDHLKKPAMWYRVDMSRKEEAKDSGILRDCKVVHVFSQLPVFPTTTHQYIETPNEEIAETTTVGEDLKYQHTKYIYLSNIVNSYIEL
ncbi:protein zwilch isoform X2 [Leptidea sinapis]|uniref:protein zwilch isoform X2 n=1 Tax=Leptidea sinapis TaxID=189913 RepID=UPI0021C433EC|nr:protein zwilch isoform X2 [Leptidea sinapis]